MKQIKLKSIWKIKKVKVILKEKSFLGYADYPNKIIYLKKARKTESTLYHELAHLFIYEIFGKSKVNKIRAVLEELNDDENFINYFGGLLKNAFRIKYYKK